MQEIIVKMHIRAHTRIQDDGARCTIYKESKNHVCSRRDKESALIRVLKGCLAAINLDIRWLRLPARCDRYKSRVAVSTGYNGT